MRAPILEFLRNRRRALRAAWWRLRHRDFLVVFNWHQVSPSFEASIHHEYTWTPLPVFAREVDWLAARFQILPLHDALQRLRQGTLTGACAALTFDDGDVSMAEHVEPLLRRRGLPATFFVNTGYLEAPRTYWFPVANHFQHHPQARDAAGFTPEFAAAAARLRATPDMSFYQTWRARLEALAPAVPALAGRLVSSQWLSGLDGEQFAIGAHGHEHQRFSMMPPDWQQADLHENVRILSQFRAFRPIFAVPFGRAHDWTQATLASARQLGLQVVLAEGGLNWLAGECWRRIPGDNRSLEPLITSAMAAA